MDEVIEVINSLFVNKNKIKFLDFNLYFIKHLSRYR